MDSIQPYNQVYKRKATNLEESVCAMEIDCQKQGLVFSPVTPAKPYNVYKPCNVYGRRKIGRLESINGSSEFGPQRLDGGVVSSDGVEIKEMGKKESFHPITPAKPRNVTPAKPSNVYVRRKVQRLESKIESSKSVPQCLDVGFLSSDGVVMEELGELSNFAEDDPSVKGINCFFAPDDGFKGDNGFKSCEESKLESIDLNVSSEDLHKIEIYNGKDIVETTHGEKGVLELGLEHNPSFGKLGQQICGGELCCCGEGIVDSIYNEERDLNEKLGDDADDGLECCGEFRQQICGEEACCSRGAIHDKERFLDKRLEDDTKNGSKGCIESRKQLCGGDFCNGEDILGENLLNQGLENDGDGVVKCCGDLGERIFEREKKLFDSNVENIQTSSHLGVSTDRTFGFLDEIGVRECNSSTVLDNDSSFELTSPTIKSDSADERFLNRTSIAVDSMPNICFQNSQFRCDSDIERNDKQSNSATAHILQMQENIINPPGRFLEECNKNQTNLAEVDDASQKDLAPSTPLRSQNLNKKHKVDIDLNKKPRQKLKKKYHTPKVVADGKPMRTPKSKISKTPSEKSSSGKRKYVRKTKIESSMPMPGDFTGPKEVHETTKVEDTVMKDDAKLQPNLRRKRKLSFDDENYLLNANFVPLDAHDLVERCSMQPDQEIKEILFHHLRFTTCFPSEFKKKRSQRRKRAIIKLFKKSGKKYKIRNVLLLYFPKTFKKKRSRNRGRHNFTSGPCKEMATVVDLEKQYLAHMHAVENPLINTFDVLRSHSRDLDCNVVLNSYSKFMVDFDTIAHADTMSSSDALIDRQDLDTSLTLEFGVPCISNHLELEQRLDTKLIGQGNEIPHEEVQHHVSNLNCVDMQLMLVPQNDPVAKGGAIVPLNIAAAVAEGGAIVPLNIAAPVAEGGTIVPYKSANKVKPAKVELDSVTMAKWSQLMLDDGRGLDYNQEKKWEEDRKVFCGRVDSFIARMHLILGDRRFTPWRGSVVDSVIGVFLTQNVSDNLSSSAFMSLAAKFPLNSPNASTWDVNIGSVHKSETEEESHSENSGDTKVAEFPMMVDEGLVENRDDKSCIDTTLPSTLFFNLGSCVTFANKSANDLKFENVSSRNEHVPSLEDTHVESHEIALHPILDGSSQEMGRNMDKEMASLREQQQTSTQKPRKEKVVQKADPAEWEHLRKLYFTYGPRCFEHTDSVNWDAVRCANVTELADTIKERGQHNLIAGRIQEFLNKLVMQQNSINLEWLRNCPPDKAKQYLLEINGLGLKSVECVRLLTLHHIAFPVDTNVARIAVRLGWVPIQPLPEQLQLHLLERYPILDDIQKYLWPRLCTLDQRTLYELHYQLITFGKVFCTKKNPNCNACPMKGECRHFASAFASAKLALPAPANNHMGPLVVYGESYENPIVTSNTSWPLFPAVDTSSKYTHATSYAGLKPIIEEPDSPEPEFSKTMEIMDIEDLYLDNDEDEVPTIMLHSKKYMEDSWSCRDKDGKISEEMSKALIALPPEVASIPLPKLKHIDRLRTEHQVYELPDDHPLLESFERREPEDPSHYLFVIWGPDNIESAPKDNYSQVSREASAEATSFQSGTTLVENHEMIRGTILIPCRTAVRSRFPLNGTYFQVNEVFADYESSCCPIDVHRDLLWNLPRRTVYFGTTTSNILRGLPIEKIQQCFLRGFVCVRSFDRKTRTPRPLAERLHKTGNKAGKRVSAANDD